jgi:pyrimidine operon attenuation protein/uracil phosphoribosyltransferase
MATEETLDAGHIAAGIGRLADAIRARTEGKSVALVGIRSRGDEVARRLLDILAADDRELAFGVLDISLYRDDFAHLTENPAIQGTDIPFSVEGAHIILVDDVLFTGRTIRAALDALSDYGRPGRVELAVLIDRGHREMPIQPDYAGIVLDTRRMDHVIVLLEETDGSDGIRIVRNEAS